jgi:SPP1 family predicted phage head-tail adaptor
MTFRPERGFRVGEMRHRIAVKVETTTQDAAGQPVVAFTTWLLDEPAKFDPMTGGEGARGRQVEAGITAIFTVRYRDGYTPEMIVVHRNQQYGIVYVNPVAGADRYRELHCKGVVT